GSWPSCGMRWEVKIKRTALSERAFDADAAPVELQDLAHVMQAEPESLDVMHVARGHAVELLEQVLLVRGRDAEAAIHDVDPDGAVLVAGADVDRLVRRTVLHRVVDEVVDDAGQMGPVAVDEVA